MAALIPTVSSFCVSPSLAGVQTARLPTFLFSKLVVSTDAAKMTVEHIETAVKRNMERNMANSDDNESR